MYLRTPLAPEEVVAMSDGIRLNRARLDVKEGKDYAELLPLGDLHYGHPCCDIERVLRQVDYCIEHRIYVLGMGDYIEAGTRNSVGDSVYMQELNPQAQTDFVRDNVFKPLSDKGLLIGLLSGNHEARIVKETSFRPVKNMCRELGVPFLGYASWNLVYVGKQSYSIYAIHGASGSRFEHTKLKAAIDISHYFDADVVLMAHAHSLIDGSTLIQRVDRKRKIVTQEKKFVVVTGHYLSYDNSYAQEKGMPIGKMGSPKIKLWGNKKDIHTSV